MLQYDTGISLIILCNYIVFVFAIIFIHSFFYNYFKSGIETPDVQWYQHLLTLFAIFYESNIEGTNFWIMIVFYVCIICMFCFVLFSGCPEMTHRGLQDLNVKASN